MSKKTSIISIIMILLFVTAAMAQSGIGFKNMTAEDLKAEMADKKSRVLVVDARTAEEYAEGHIPGAINIPPERFKAIAGYLPTNKSAPIVFYCRGYNCTLSQSAAMAALRAGYTNIRLYRGGFPEWSAKGYKIAK